MGRFTEDMGRLRDEIESDRHARQAKVVETRQAISDLKDSVEALQADFREAHADMAQAGRADRHAFLGQLGNAVANIQRQAVDLVEDFASERSAAARAWRGEATTQRSKPAHKPAKPAHKSKR
jgi:uncharacterized protein YukE